MPTKPTRRSSSAKCCRPSLCGSTADCVCTLSSRASERKCLATALSGSRATSPLSGRRFTTRSTASCPRKGSQRKYSSASKAERQGYHNPDSNQQRRHPLVPSTAETILPFQASPTYSQRAIFPRNGKEPQYQDFPYHLWRENIGGCACVYSEGNAYLCYLAAKRKTYSMLHPDTMVVWNAIQYAYEHNYNHIYFMDVGLPWHRNPFREFILSFGGNLSPSTDGSVSTATPSTKSCHGCTRTNNSILFLQLPNLLKNEQSFLRQKRKKQQKEKDTKKGLRYACPIPLLSNSSPRSVQIPRTMTIKKLSKMVCMEYMR